MGRPTLKSIEPSVYIAYVLNCSDNISIERALNMSKDTKGTVSWKNKGGWNENHKKSEVIRWRVNSILEEFWNKQGLKPFSTSDEVFEFFEKYSKPIKKVGIFGGIINWFKRIQIGP